MRCWALSYVVRQKLDLIFWSYLSKLTTYFTSYLKFLLYSAFSYITNKVLWPFRIICEHIAGKLMTTAGAHVTPLFYTWETDKHSGFSHCITQQVADKISCHISSLCFGSCLWFTTGGTFRSFLGQLRENEAEKTTFFSVSTELRLKAAAWPAGEGGRSAEHQCRGP